MAVKKKEGTPLGENILVSQEGDELVLRISLKAKGKPSASGKTIVVASTRGNKPIAGLVLGVNAYKYPEV